MRRISTSVMICCLALEACSSRPREFTPSLSAAPVDAGQFDAAYANCRELIASGNFARGAGKGGSAAAGAAAGAGTAAVGGTAAVAAGGYAGLAAASATIVLLPFAIVGGAWGMSRMKRAKKERAIKTAMEACLHERGYAVAGWSKALKKPIVSAP